MLPTAPWLKFITGFIYFFVIFSKSTHTNELYDESVMLFQTEGGHVTSINLKKKKEKRCSMEIGIATTTLYKGLHIALSNQILSLHSFTHSHFIKPNNLFTLIFTHRHLYILYYISDV